jgi:O-antigen/teichoic acid export membrane protein
LIPPYGMLGAAYATFFSYLLMDLLAYLINIRIYPVTYEWLRLLKIILVTVVILFILNRIQVYSWKMELVYKLPILLLFPVFLWITGFFTSSELKRAKDFILELGEKLKFKKAYHLIFRKK